jgi:antitoxin component YwqK of YwqJK toxin-antitoxin module
MLKLNKILFVGVFLSLQTLRAGSVYVEQGWNLLSNTDTEQNTSCLLEKMSKPSFVWTYDNVQKKWFAKSNDNNTNTKITNVNILPVDTLKPYQSFWIYSVNQANIDFDCNVSLHVDVNKTKTLQSGWNLISNIDANQSAFSLLNENNSTKLLYVYDNVQKNWFAKTNDFNMSKILTNSNILQIDTLLPYQSFWIYNDDNVTNIDFNSSVKIVQMFYQEGDLKDYNLTNLHTSFKQTTGAIVQAILAINSLLFTDINETNITEFRDRKAQADEALDILIELSSQTENYADALPDPTEVGRLLRTTATPQEIYAIINNSKIKGHIKTLMLHFNVGAHQAKKILDDAMSALESKYSKKADYYTKAIVISQAIRDTSALAVTVGSAVVTAGATTTVLGVAETVITGADATIKATKSLTELYLGKDGALDGTIKNSTILRGLSDASELISIKGLFSNPSKISHEGEKVADIIGKFTWITDKARDAFFDKKINLGEEEISFSKVDNKEINATKKALESTSVPSTFIGNFEVNTSKIYAGKDSNVLETNVTKVLDLNNTKIAEGNIKKIITPNSPTIIKKILEVLPEEKRIDETKKMIQNSVDILSKPQWCPQQIDSDNVFFYGADRYIDLGENKVAYCNYFDDGRLSNEFMRIEGKRSGVEKSYSETFTGDEYYFGQITYWNNDSKVGTEVSYYDSGNVYSITPYVDGKIEGRNVEFFRDGSISSEKPYKNDELDGIWRTYYESGQIELEMQYVDGKENGYVRYYKESGCLSYEDIYKDDELIDITYYQCSGD